MNNRQIIKYKDVIVGKYVRLGKFLAQENRAISGAIGKVTYKESGGSGGHIKVCVVGHEDPYIVHLHNIKGVYETADDFDRGFIDGQDCCVELIKKHFGVE